MSQGPLCPNLSQKVQKEVSQMANRNLSCVILLGGLSVNLNHLKREVCDHPNQNQSGSYSEHPSSTHSKGMQKLLWSGKLPESLLSKLTKASSSNL